MEHIYIPRGGFDLPVSSTDLNRPSLQLTGFFAYFDNRRIQLFGRVEMAYLATLDSDARKEAVRGRVQAAHPACHCDAGHGYFSGDA